ncbi:MAG: CHAP domain-containing protein [Candidatus Dormibacteraeota bacterium]|nr:CHAP domain-containing protein [Candidatus Dormibacteraeota bacterium]
MRRRQKLVLIAAGLGTLLATGIGSITVTHATTSPVDALRARRAALLAELVAMQPSIDSAGGQLNAAESAYQTQQQKVLQTQQHLASLNAQLQSLDGQMTADQATIAQDKADLGTIIRATYESAGNDQVLAAVLSSNDFTQAMDRLRNASQVSHQVSDLVAKLSGQEQQIREDRVQIKTDFAQASTLEQQLSSMSNQLLAVLMNRNFAFNTLDGPARAIAAQIATIDEEIAAAQMPSYAGGGSCGDHFAYGQCTWYVASRRCVPWVGNADQWYYNAAAMGFKEGHVPAPGAIVVFWPGGDGASGIGHVAYVEAVGPANGIPAGYFLQSEMNFAGWDRVSYRTLPDNSPGIQGFIYGQ